MKCNLGCAVSAGSEAVVVRNLNDSLQKARSSSSGQVGVELNNASHCDIITPCKRSRVGVLISGTGKSSFFLN